MFAVDSVISSPAMLKARLQSWWRFKLIGGGFITIGFFATYGALQRWPLISPQIMTSIELDRWVSFNPNAVWLYASLWLYIPIAPWLVAKRQELMAYSAALCGMCMVGMVVFLLFPRVIVRPASDTVPYAAYRLLVAMDGPSNAFPSMHAAFAIFSACCIQRLFGELRIPKRWILISWTWCIGILYATLATKQHVTLDLLGGTVLGLAAFATFRTFSSPLEEPR